jgi:Family of unknown function (DUF6493)
MSRTTAELEHALQAGDAPAVAAFFKGATELERKPFAPVVAGWHEILALNLDAHYFAEKRDRIPAGQRFANYHELYPAAFAATLACGSLADVKAVRNTWGLEEELATILGDRSPPWVQEYCDFRCGQQFGWVQNVWRQVRVLVRAGLCTPPEHDNYVLGVFEGIRPMFHYRDNQHRAAQGLSPLPQPTIKELLLGPERDWLERTFWRVFEVEGNGRTGLANDAKYGGAGWSQALLELARDGVLPRERLLDASLSALSRGFRQFRAAPFAHIHEALAPTPQERAARLDTYLALLASDIPPTVSLALDAVLIVDDVRPVPAATLLPALESVLAARTKKTVRTALKLLDRSAAREPASRGAVCLAATGALLNDAADVQKDVFAVLEKHGDKRDPKLRARLFELSGAVRASLGPELKRWIGALSPAENPVPASPEVTLTISSSANESRRIVPPTDPSRAITPIVSVDELLDRAAAMLETPEDTDAVERVLDGICRLCDRRPASFERRAGPLAKRALTFVTRFHRGPNYNPAMEQALARVLLSWLAATDVLPQAENFTLGEREPTQFLFRRLRAIAAQAARGRALPLLSAPTHCGGWIAAAALVTRWLEWQRAGATPDLHEQVLALLRLAPEGRAEALPAARELEGEAGRAVRHALGEDEKPGPDPAIWLAAYRSQQPHGDLPEFERAHPKLGPDAGTGARYVLAARSDVQMREGVDARKIPLEVRTQPAMPAQTEPALFPVFCHQPVPWLGISSRPLLRWQAQLWPANREPFFARGITTLQVAVGWSDTRDRETIGCLEPLADPHTELRAMACHALALGLAAKDAVLRGHAQEALIAAIADGRVPAAAAELGATMAFHFHTAGNKVGRWAKCLGEVARISDAHARAVGELVQHALRGDPANAPREVGVLLEVLVEVLSATNMRITVETARDYLAGCTGSGKPAKLARQLLAR